MRLTLYMFHLMILFLLISVAPSLGQPDIVKSLPGYPENLPFSLETGYIGVGEEEQVKLFYYFIESERDVERDPLMLWLTGGPGCSGFSALVFEIGPLAFNLSATSSESSPPKLELNPYSWTKVANIIFLDSPVGAGFSYASTSEAYYSSDTLQSAHIYDFLRKWFIKHPKFMKNSLYISGDSYVGLIVPIVVKEILQGNEMESRPKMNLKGYVLGNPTVLQGLDKNSIYKYAHRISLLPDELYESAVTNCKGDLSDFVTKNTRNIKCLRDIEALKQEIRLMNNPHVLEHNCIFASPHKYQKIDHLLLDPPSGLHIVEGEFCRNQHYLLAYSWADDEQVREALHVQEGSKDHWVRCNHSIAYDRNVQSVFDYHLNFSTKSLQVLVYSGDQDMTIPYVGTRKWIEELKIPISDDWRPWFVDGQVAGYTTSFSRLPYQIVYTTIKGGGHTAPEYKPRECLAMMDRWFSLSPL